MRFVLWVTAFLVLVTLSTHVMAQGNPFGLPGAKPPPPPEGIGAWLLQRQAEFHRAMTLALSKAARDGSAAATLLGLAFAYGVVHAIGPGHGKAVISGYIIANETALRRGVALSFLAAGVQALIALGVVIVIAVATGGTARDVDRSVLLIEQMGFALIFGMGLWIAYRKLRALQSGSGHDIHCDHDHGLPPDKLATQSRGALLGAAIGAGIRPCTGAIILLVFALSQRLYWLGALSVAVMAIGTAIGTSLFALLAVKAKHFALWLASGRGDRSRRIQLGMEAVAGLLLALIGLALLTGTMTAGS
ncbi:COG2215 ABC-type uncharacterized transport system, permease component [Rhabdaerophilaceae bacterium]